MNWFWGIALAAMVAGPAVAQDNRVSTAVNGTSAEQRERTSSGALSVSLIGRRVDDDVINSAFSRSSIAIELGTRYRDWLKGTFKAGQVLTSGTTSNLYAVTEASASSFAYIDEASATVTPILTDRFETRVAGGIIPVAQNPISSALWNKNAWATGRVELEQKGDDGKLTLGMQQSIPSTKDISNRITDDDVLPLYSNASLTGSLGIGGGWTVKTSAAHFVFTDLASNAAVDSYRTGASVTGSGKTAFFDYEYRGNEIAAQLEHKADSGDTLTFSASALKNDLAPDGRAELAKLSYKRVGGTWNWTTSLDAFRMESDSIPSLYTNPGNGFTNRRGGSVSLKAEHAKEKFAFTAGYTRADVLDLTKQAVLDGYQADRDMFTIGAEVKHDIF